GDAGVGGDAGGEPVAGGGGDGRRVGDGDGGVVGGGVVAVEHAHVEVVIVLGGGDHDVAVAAGLAQDLVAGEHAVDIGRPVGKAGRAVGLVVGERVVEAIELKAVGDVAARVVEGVVIGEQKPEAMNDGVVVNIHAVVEEIHLGDAGADALGNAFGVHQGEQGLLAAAGADGVIEVDHLGAGIELVVGGVGRALPRVDHAVNVTGDDIDLVGAGGEEVLQDVVAESAEAVVPTGRGAGEQHVAADAGGRELVVREGEKVDVFLGGRDLVVHVGQVGLVADFPILGGQIEGWVFVSVDQIRNVGGDALVDGRGV